MPDAQGEPAGPQHPGRAGNEDDRDEIIGASDGGDGDGGDVVGSHPQLDPSVSDVMREGLTGTTPSNVYRPIRDPEIMTLPPDGRPLHYQPAWRKEFPIDWPQDTHIARRDFTKFMVVTSLAFAVGQVWIGAQNLWRKHRGRPPIRKVASLDALPRGGSIVFNYPGENDPCILVRTEDDALVAYSQKCTHLSCAVVPRLEEQRLYCPCHEGVFDLPSGRNLAGPPQRPLPRITLDRRGDDIYATGVQWRTA